MKTHELQIGDLVHVMPSSMLIRVAAVHHKKVAYHEYTHKLSWVRDGLLRPIPISKEILEKNFEKKIHHGIFDDYFDFEIWEYSDSMYVAYYHSCEFSLPDSRILGISYVHELQHVLKMFGIKKEIVL